MPKEITLRMLLQNPIDGLLYGLQKGKGTAYEIVQPQVGAGHDLHFEFVVPVKEASKPVMSLGGPFVQGPAGARFVYLNIGSYAGNTGAAWNGRLKVPLPESVFSNADGTSDVWSCSVPGQTADGKPVFATVKPFSRWSKEDHSE